MEALRSAGAGWLQRRAWGIVKQYLGAYLDFERDSADVIGTTGVGSILTGHFKASIRNVRLRPEALRRLLGIPFLFSGRVGEVTVEIAFGLGGAIDAEVVLRDVVVQVERDTDVSAAKSEQLVVERTKELRRKRLEGVEMRAGLKEAMASGGGGGERGGQNTKAGGSWTDAIRYRIKDNLRFFLENVEITYLLDKEEQTSGLMRSPGRRHREADAPAASSSKSVPEEAADKRSRVKNEGPHQEQETTDSSPCYVLLLSSIKIENVDPETMQPTQIQRNTQGLAQRVVKRAELSDLQVISAKDRSRYVAWREAKAEKKRLDEDVEEKRKQAAALRVQELKELGTSSTTTGRTATPGAGAGTPSTVGGASTPSGGFLSSSGNEAATSSPLPNDLSSGSTLLGKGVQMLNEMELRKLEERILQGQKTLDFVLSPSSFGLIFEHSINTSDATYYVTGAIAQIAVKLEEQTLANYREAAAMVRKHFRHETDILRRIQVFEPLRRLLVLGDLAALSRKGKTSGSAAEVADHEALAPLLRRARAKARWHWAMLCVLHIRGMSRNTKRTWGQRFTKEMLRVEEEQKALFFALHSKRDQLLATGARAGTTTSTTTPNKNENEKVEDQEATSSSTTTGSLGGELATADRLEMEKLELEVWNFASLSTWLEEYLEQKAKATPQPQSRAAGVKNWFKSRVFGWGSSGGGEEEDNNNKADSPAGTSAAGEPADGTDDGNIAVTTPRPTAAGRSKGLVGERGVVGAATSPGVDGAEDVDEEQLENITRALSEEVLTLPTEAEVTRRNQVEFDVKLQGAEVELLRRDGSRFTGRVEELRVQYCNNGISEAGAQRFLRKKFVAAAARTSGGSPSRAGGGAQNFYVQTPGAGAPALKKGTKSSLANLMDAAVHPSSSSMAKTANNEDVSPAGGHPRDSGSTASPASAFEDEIARKVGEQITNVKSGGAGASGRKLLTDLGIQLGTVVLLELGSVQLSGESKEKLNPVPELHLIYRGDAAAGDGLIETRDGASLRGGGGNNFGGGNASQTGSVSGVRYRNPTSSRVLNLPENLVPGAPVSFTPQVPTSRDAGSRSRASSHEEPRLDSSGAVSDADSFMEAESTLGGAEQVEVLFVPEDKRPVLLEKHVIGALLKIEFHSGMEEGAPPRMEIEGENLVIDYQRRLLMQIMDFFRSPPPAAGGAAEVNQAGSSGSQPAAGAALKSKDISTASSDLLAAPGDAPNLLDNYADPDADPAPEQPQTGRWRSRFRRVAESAVELVVKLDAPTLLLPSRFFYRKDAAALALHLGFLEVHSIGSVTGLVHEVACDISQRFSRAERRSVAMLAQGFSDVLLTAERYGITVRNVCAACLQSGNKQTMHEFLRMRRKNLRAGAGAEGPSATSTSAAAGGNRSEPSSPKIADRNLPSSGIKQVIRDFSLNLNLDLCVLDLIPPGETAKQQLTHISGDLPKLQLILDRDSYDTVIEALRLTFTTFGAYTRGGAAQGSFVPVSMLQDDKYVRDNFHTRESFLLDVAVRELGVQLLDALAPGKKILSPTTDPSAPDYLELTARRTQLKIKSRPVLTTIDIALENVTMARPNALRVADRQIIVTDWGAGGVTTGGVLSKDAAGYGVGAGAAPPDPGGGGSPKVDVGGAGGGQQPTRETSSTAAGVEDVDVEQRRSFLRVGINTVHERAPKMEEMYEYCHGASWKIDVDLKSLRLNYEPMIVTYFICFLKDIPPAENIFERLERLKQHEAGGAVVESFGAGEGRAADPVVVSQIPTKGSAPASKSKTSFAVPVVQEEDEAEMLPSRRGRGARSPSPIKISGKNKSQEFELGPVLSGQQLSALEGASEAAAGAFSHRSPSGATTSPETYGPNGRYVFSYHPSQHPYAAGARPHDPSASSNRQNPYGGTTTNPTSRMTSKMSGASAALWPFKYKIMFRCSSLQLRWLETITDAETGVPVTHYFADASCTNSSFDLLLYEERVIFDSKFGNFRIQDLSNAHTPTILGFKKALGGDPGAGEASLTTSSIDLGNAGKDQEDAAAADWDSKMKEPAPGMKYLSVFVKTLTLADQKQEDPLDVAYQLKLHFDQPELFFLKEKFMRCWRWIMNSFIPSLTASPEPRYLPQLHLDSRTNSRATTPTPQPVRKDSELYLDADEEERRRSSNASLGSAGFRQSRAMSLSERIQAEGRAAVGHQVVVPPLEGTAAEQGAPTTPRTAAAGPRLDPGSRTPPATARIMGGPMGTSPRTVQPSHVELAMRDHIPRSYDLEIVVSKPSIYFPATTTGQGDLVEVFTEKELRVTNKACYIVDASRLCKANNTFVYDARKNTYVEKSSASHPGGARAAGAAGSSTSTVTNHKWEWEMNGNGWGGEQSEDEFSDYEDERISYRDSHVYGAGCEDARIGVDIDLDDADEGTPAGPGRSPMSSSPSSKIGAGALTPTGGAASWSPGAPAGTSKSPSLASKNSKRAGVQLSPGFREDDALDWSAAAGGKKASRHEIFMNPQNANPASLETVQRRKRLNHYGWHDRMFVQGSEIQVRRRTCRGVALPLDSTSRSLGGGTIAFDDSSQLNSSPLFDQPVELSLEFVRGIESYERLEFLHGWLTERAKRPRYRYFPWSYKLRIALSAVTIVLNLREWNFVKRVFFDNLAGQDEDVAVRENRYLRDVQDVYERIAYRRFMELLVDFSSLKLVVRLDGSTVDDLSHDAFDCWLRQNLLRAQDHQQEERTKGDCSSSVDGTQLPTEVCLTTDRIQFSLVKYCGSQCKFDVALWEAKMFHLPVMHAPFGGQLLFRDVDDTAAPAAPAPADTADVRLGFWYTRLLNESDLQYATQQIRRRRANPDAGSPGGAVFSPDIFAAARGRHESDVGEVPDEDEDAAMETDRDGMTMGEFLNIQRPGVAERGKNAPYRFAPATRGGEDPSPHQLRTPPPASSRPEELRSGPRINNYRGGEEDVSASGETSLRTGLPRGELYPEEFFEECLPISHLRDSQIELDVLIGEPRVIPTAVPLFLLYKFFWNDEVLPGEQAQSSRPPATTAPASPMERAGAGSKSREVLAASSPSPGLVPQKTASFGAGGSPAVMLVAQPSPIAAASPQEKRKRVLEAYTTAALQVPRPPPQQNSYGASASSSSRASPYKQRGARGDWEFAQLDEEDWDFGAGDFQRLFHAQSWHYSHRRLARVGETLYGAGDNGAAAFLSRPIEDEVRQQLKMDYEMADGGALGSGAPASTAQAAGGPASAASSSATSTISSGEEEERNLSGTNRSGPGPRGPQGPGAGPAAGVANVYSRDSNVDRRIRKAVRGGSVKVSVKLRNPSVVFPTAFSSEKANYLVMHAEGIQIDFQTRPDEELESIASVVQRMRDLVRRTVFKALGGPTSKELHTGSGTEQQERLPLTWDFQPFSEILRQFDQLLGTKSFLPPQDEFLPRVNYQFSDFLKFWSHIENDPDLWGQITRKRSVTFSLNQAGIVIQRKAAQLKEGKKEGSVLLQDFNLWFGNQENTRRGYIVDMFRLCAPESPSSFAGANATKEMIRNVDEFFRTREGADHQNYLFFRHKHTYLKLTNLQLKLSYEDCRTIVHCVQWQQQSLSRLRELEAVADACLQGLGGAAGGLAPGTQNFNFTHQQEAAAGVDNPNQQQGAGAPAAAATAEVPMDRYRSFDAQVKGASLELLNDCGQEVAYPFFRVDITRLRCLSETMAFFDRSIFKTRTVHKTSRGVYVDFYGEYFNPVAVCYEPLFEGLDLFGEKAEILRKEAERRRMLGGLYSGVSDPVESGVPVGTLDLSDRQRGKYDATSANDDSWETGSTTSTQSTRSVSSRASKRSSMSDFTKKSRKNFNPFWRKQARMGHLKEVIDPNQEAASHSIPSVRVTISHEFGDIRRNDAREFLAIFEDENRAVPTSSSTTSTGTGARPAAANKNSKARVVDHHHVEDDRQIRDYEQLVVEAKDQIGLNVTETLADVLLSNAREWVADYQGADLDRSFVNKHMELFLRSFVLRRYLVNLHFQRRYLGAAAGGKPMWRLGGTLPLGATGEFFVTPEQSSGAAATSEEEEDRRLRQEIESGEVVGYSPQVDSVGVSAALGTSAAAEAAASMSSIPHGGGSGGLPARIAANKAAGENQPDEGVTCALVPVTSRLAPFIQDNDIPILPVPDDIETPFWESKVVKTVDRVPIAPYSLENMKGNRDLLLEIPGAGVGGKITIVSGEDRRLRELVVEPKSSAAIVTSRDARPDAPQVHLHLPGGRVQRQLSIARTGAHCYRVVAPRRPNFSSTQTHHDYYGGPDDFSGGRGATSGYESALFGGSSRGGGGAAEPDPSAESCYELVCRGVSAEVRKLCVLQSSVLVHNGFANVPLLCEIESPGIPDHFGPRRDYVLIHPEEEISLPLDACRGGLLRFAPLLGRSGLMDLLEGFVGRAAKSSESEAELDVAKAAAKRTATSGGRQPMLRPDEQEDAGEVGGAAASTSRPAHQPAAAMSSRVSALLKFTHEQAEIVAKSFPFSRRVLVAKIREYADNHDHVEFPKELVSCVISKQQTNRRNNKKRGNIGASSGAGNRDADRSPSTSSSSEEDGGRSSSTSSSEDSSDEDERQPRHSAHNSSFFHMYASLECEVLPLCDRTGTVTQCTLHLQPTMQLRSNLPFPIVYQCLPGPPVEHSLSYNIFGSNKNAPTSATTPPMTNEECEGRITLNNREDIYQVNLEEGPLALTLCLYGSSFSPPVDFYRPAFNATLQQKSRTLSLLEPHYVRQPTAGAGLGGADINVASSARSSTSSRNDYHQQVRPNPRKNSASSRGGRTAPAYYNAMQIPGATNFTQRNFGTTSSAGGAAGGSSALGSGRSKRRQMAQQLSGSSAHGDSAVAAKQASSGAAGAGATSEEEIVYDRLRFPVFDGHRLETNLWLEFQNHPSGVLDIILFTEVMLCNYLPSSISNNLRFVYYDRGGRNDLKSSNSLFTDFFTMNEEGAAPNSSNYVADESLVLLLDVARRGSGATSSSRPGGGPGGGGRKRYTGIADLEEDGGASKGGSTGVSDQVVSGLNRGAGGDFTTDGHLHSRGAGGVGGKSTGAEKNAAGGVGGPPPSNNPGAASAGRDLNLYAEVFSSLMKPYSTSSIVNRRVPGSKRPGPRYIYTEENAMNLPYPCHQAFEMALDRGDVRLCTREERQLYLRNQNPYAGDQKSLSSAEVAATSSAGGAAGGGSTNMLTTTPAAANNYVNLTTHLKDLIDKGAQYRIPPQAVQDKEKIRLSPFSTRFMCFPQAGVCAQMVDTQPIYLPLDCETESLQAVFREKYLSDEEQRVEHLDNIGNRGEVEVNVFRKDSFLWKKYRPVFEQKVSGGISSSASSSTTSAHQAADGQSMFERASAAALEKNRYLQVTATATKPAIERDEEELNRIAEKVMFRYKITQAHNLDRSLPPLRCINIVPRVLFVNDMPDPVYVRQGTNVAHISWNEKDLYPRDIQDAMRDHLPEVIVPPGGGLLPVTRWSVYGKFGLEVRYRDYAYSGCVPCWLPGEYHLVLFDNRWQEDKQKGELQQIGCSYVTCCIEVVENVSQGTTYMTMHSHYANKADQGATNSGSSGTGTSASTSQEPMSGAGASSLPSTPTSSVGGGSSFSASSTFAPAARGRGPASSPGASSDAGSVSSAVTSSTATRIANLRPPQTPLHPIPEQRQPHHLQAGVHQVRAGTSSSSAAAGSSQPKTRNIGTGFQLVNCCRDNTRIIIRQNLGDNPQQNKLLRGQEWHDRYFKQLKRDSPTYKQEKQLITEAFKVDPKNLFQLPWIQVPANVNEPLWFGWYEVTLAGRLDVRVGNMRETQTIDFKNATNGGTIPVIEEVVGGANRAGSSRPEVRKYVMQWELKKIGPVEYLIFWKQQTREERLLAVGGGVAGGGGGSSTNIAYAALAPLAPKSQARVLKLHMKGIGLSLVGKIRKTGRHWVDDFFNATKNIAHRNGTLTTLKGGLDVFKDAVDSYAARQQKKRNRSSGSGGAYSGAASGVGGHGMMLPSYGAAGNEYGNAEILFCYLEEIAVSVGIYPTHTEYDLNIRDLQLDTQLRHTHFPVCMSRDPSAGVGGGAGGVGGAELAPITEEGPQGGQSSDMEPERQQEQAAAAQRRAQEKAKEDAIVRVYVRERTKITAQSMDKVTVRERYGNYDILYLDKVRLKIKPVLLMFDLKLVQILLSLVYKFQNAIEVGLGREERTAGGTTTTQASSSRGSSGGGAGTTGGIMRGSAGSGVGAGTSTKAAGGAAAANRVSRAKEMVKLALHQDVIGFRDSSSSPLHHHVVTHYKSFSDFFGHLNWKEANPATAKQKLVKVFFEDFLFDKMRLVASFDPGEEAQFGLRNAFFAKILTALSGIESCPLDFDPMVLRNTLGQGSGIGSLLKSMTEFYKNQCVMQLNRLLLSSNFFGNPQMFFTYVGDGAYAFMKEPYEGFQRGAVEGMMGFGKGTTSLFRNVTTGFADSSAKLLASFNQGLATLSLDSQYTATGKRSKRAETTSQALTTGNRAGGETLAQLRQRHDANARSDNTYAAFEGFFRGTESVFKGLSDGVTGVFTQPFQAATGEDRSIERVAEGTVRGVAGLFAKPIVGVGEGLKCVFEGIRDQAIGVDDTILRQKARSIPRIRLPRCLYGEDRVLRPYFYAHAKLKLQLEEAFGCTDALVAHQYNRDSRSEVIITENCLICRINLKNVIGGVVTATASSSFIYDDDAAGAMSSVPSSRGSVRASGDPRAALTSVGASSHSSLSSGFVAMPFSLPTSALTDPETVFIAAKDDYQTTLADKTENNRTKLIITLRDNAEIHLVGSREEMDACKLVLFTHCSA